MQYHLIFMLFIYLSITIIYYIFIRIVSILLFLSQVKKYLFSGNSFPFT